jgi:hypothetical protein
MRADHETHILMLTRNSALETLAGTSETLPLLNNHIKLVNVLSVPPQVQSDIVVSAMRTPSSQALREGEPLFD